MRARGCLIWLLLFSWPFNYFVKKLTAKPLFLIPLWVVLSLLCIDTCWIWTVGYSLRTPDTIPLCWGWLHWSSNVSIYIFDLHYTGEGSDLDSEHHHPGCSITDIWIWYTWTKTSLRSFWRTFLKPAAKKNAQYLLCLSLSCSIKDMKN